MRPDENITTTITFNQGGVGPAKLPLEFRKDKKWNTDTPIGTIVPSLLNYNDFLALNGLDFEGDINKVIWVPCDGRQIGTEEGTYGAFSGGEAPDLRGLFLRAVNDMGAYNPTVPTPKSENLNPENKKSGQIQQDLFESHDHGITTYNDKYPRSGGSVYDMWRNDKATRTTKEGGSETRPKNISVYYYIKIR